MMPYALSRFIRRLRLILDRRAFERDLDEEMRFHMDMATERNLGRGVPPAEVAALTTREFGSMDRFKDEVRDARGLTLSDDIVRDVRFAVRTLRRTPGFTALALLTFGLGIGATTAIFSVVNAVLLRPLPYPNAERLVRVYEQLKGKPEMGSVAVLNWRDWQRDATAFEALGGFTTSGAILGGDAEPERVRATYVSAEVLPMLGVRPMLGRWFTRDEEIKGKHHVVILSEPLWRNRFGGDRGIVGREIRIEGLPYTVVGVMPETFNFPLGPVQTQLWAPFVPPDMAIDPRARGWHWMSVIAILKPVVTLEQANADIVRVAAQLEQRYPGPQANRTAAVVPMREDVVGDVQPTLLVLLGAVVLVLVIACANVANLLLARNAARRKDAAVRAALGASRGRLMRQLLIESVALALGGALLGLAFAYGGLRALTVLSGSMLPIVEPISMDGRVLATLIVSAVVCGVAFGLAPALKWTRGGLRHDLADLTVKTTSGSEMRRFRSALVVTQIALSLMLLIGAGLLMRAFVTLQSTDVGIATDRVLTARIAVPSRYTGDDDSELKLVLRPVLERVRLIPGVRQAGIVSLLPIQETGAQVSFWVDGRPWPKAGTEPFAEIRTVSPGYFTAMGIPLKTGRDIQERDDSMSVSKVIVNETLVRTYFPGENPIGRRLFQGSETQHFQWEIVGVSGDVRQSGVDEAPRMEIYTSYADMRANFARGDVALVVKTSVPPGSIVPELRRALKAVAADVALMNVRPMDEVIDRSLASRKLILLLFGAFAGIAVVLAASGLYGVIYYLVTQRTREIGIRVALGADKARVVRLVLGQGVLLALSGIVVGLVGAVVLSRLLASLLYGVGTHDPVTFVTVPIALGIVALLASAVPAWRAARVDPVIALRSE
jgi:predicted permease